MSKDTPNQSNSDKEFEEWVLTNFNMRRWQHYESLDSFGRKVWNHLYHYKVRCERLDKQLDCVLKTERERNEKIQTLEAKVKELEKLRYVPIAYGDKDKAQTLEALLIEACKEIYWSTRYDEDSGILSIEDCEPERQRYDGHKIFLNKPEIKKLRGKE